MRSIYKMFFRTTTIKDIILIIISYLPICRPLPVADICVDLPIIAGVCLCRNVASTYGAINLWCEYTFFFFVL